MMKWFPLNGMDLIPVRQLKSEAWQVIDDESVRLIKKPGTFACCSVDYLKRSILVIEK